MLYYTFAEILKTVCLERDPKEILEWGPGKSTYIMSECCPDAKILSIEHNAKYYQKILSNVKSPNVDLKHIPRPHQNTGNGFGYVCYPVREMIKEQGEVNEKFDLIFVDGRSRCDCLTIAFLLIKEDGIVILHDSQRKRYQDGIDLFPFVFRDENRDQTAVMSKSQIEFSSFSLRGKKGE